MQIRRTFNTKSFQLKFVSPIFLIFCIVFFLSILAKKSGRYIIAALLAALGIAGPLGLKAIAVIAGKALLISKIALTIASIIALKKIYSNDHHHETQVQVLAGDHRRNGVYGRPSKHKKTPSTSMDPYRYYNDYWGAHH